MFVAAYRSQQTRGLAREERLQVRLSETYVTLTDYALRTRQYALTAMPDVPEDSDLREPPFSPDEWRALRARVFAFASDRVMGLFDDC